MASPRIKGNKKKILMSEWTICLRLSNLGKFRKAMRILRETLEVRQWSGPECFCGIPPKK